MDTEGNCYPSQDEITATLGVCRQAANKRIGSLINYRWQDKPVVIVAKNRKDAVTGKIGRTSYETPAHFSGVAGVHKFDKCILRDLLCIVVMPENQPAGSNSLIPGKPE
jgi:hypothetical protein